MLFEDGDCLTTPQTFHILDSRELFLPAKLINATAFKGLMQGLIAREPKELRRHVQYIHSLLACFSSDSNAIFLALLDLFVVLEARGLALRTRLLKLAKPHLRHSDFDFLISNLSAGIDLKTSLPEGCCSLLSRSYSGRTDFIKKQSSTSLAFSSTYEEAQSLLEYGDLECAQYFLEQSLKEQPEDATIAAELLTVYKHNDDQKALLEMTEWFVESDLNLPGCWPLL